MERTSGMISISNTSFTSWIEDDNNIGRVHRCKDPGILAVGKRKSRIMAVHQQMENNTTMTREKSKGKGCPDWDHTGDPEEFWQDRLFEDHRSPGSKVFKPSNCSPKTPINIDVGIMSMIVSDVYQQSGKSAETFFEPISMAVLSAKELSKLQQTCKVRDAAKRETRLSKLQQTCKVRDAAKRETRRDVTVKTSTNMQSERCGKARDADLSLCRISHFACLLKF
ncbi:hypothetical protein K435DRAFT_805862 [Dendrothele bispora CBS 962.96]|uniref:Uncharacterized protein n=1 Tax=Dendrothele bispora (strain CBS 962.96) TaxID=1314807 RepID=A0A4S8LA43_DENBC|nr:hypothetical protein K435DRAFT_805862 [Dendrothele bispora CBS 962.96]